MSLRFEKYEGLGNDFMVVDAESETALDEQLAVKLCDRHFGVGADGVLWVLPPGSAEARARMVVTNADGSRPEMCGNGLRCVALHLARQDGVQHQSYLVDTDRGLLSCQVERTGDQALVSIEMGRGEAVGDHQQTFEGALLRFVRISMGNPHAIVFDTSYDEAAIDRLGPLVSGALAGGSNVELARFRSAKELDLVVWERGVGRTLACGTGASATVVAAALAGRAPFDEPVRVHLPGGPLDITVTRETLEVTMRGPARRVFSGEVV